MKFTYTAIKENGEKYEGSMRAESKHELYRKLEGQGETLLSVTEEGSESSASEWRERINLFLSRISTEDKVMFTRNLGAMIEAGLSLSRALDVIKRQSENKKLRKVVAGIQDTIRGGESFSAGLEKYPNVFSSLFINMVRAGEESGNVAGVLDRLSKQLKQAYDLKRKIRGAMMYPAIVVVAMVLVGIAMMIYVVPTLTSTFKELDADLPLSTQFIIAVSDFMKNNVILTFGGLIGLGAAGWGSLQTRRGKRAFEWILLHMPLIAPLVKQINAARTARTLSSLLDAGVDVVRAFEITEGVIQNSYYKEVLAEAREAVKGGGSMAQVFQKKEDLYPAFVGEMIAVGEETGEVSSLLGRVASFYEEEVARKTDDLSSIIEPFLMIVIGIIVGFFALSMITPMYSLTGSI